MVSQEIVPCQPYVYLPGGQSWVLHSPLIESGPPQLPSPSFLCLGLQTLVLNRAPVPHSLVHSDHSPHGPWVPGLPSSVIHAVTGKYLKNQSGMSIFQFEYFVCQNHEI